MIDLPPSEICIPVMIEGKQQQVCVPRDNEENNMDKKANPVPNSGGVPIKPPPGTTPTPTPTPNNS
jgi:hypothetical protein